MKTIKLIFLFPLLVVISCSDNNAEDLTQEISDEVYTCPMHPEIESDQAGNCPKCKMKLVLKNDENNSDLDYLIQPTNEFVLSEINTVQMVQQKVHDLIHATGSIEYDLREIHSVSARISGRIEKLYVHYEFEPVKKGQKLLEIYSEELMTEQENYIFLLTNDAENKNLIQSTEKRLELLGMESGQITQLKQNLISINSVVIKSPYAGHLHSTAQSSVSKSDNQNAMSGMQTNQNSNSDTWLREGSYINKGENLFTIYNTKKVWAILNIPSEYLAEIEIGKAVKIWFAAGEIDTIFASISYIEPTMNLENNSVRVRIYLDNPTDNYKIGTIINAEVDLGEKQGNFVPESAVLNLGNDDVVFIKQDKVFVSRSVETGSKSNGMIEIISGINKDDNIAANAQMMVDSESFVKIPGKKN